MAFAQGNRFILWDNVVHTHRHGATAVWCRFVLVALVCVDELIDDGMGTDWVGGSCDNSAIYELI